MRVKGHHLYLGGVGTGLLMMSYREWVLFALAFVAGCAVTLLVVNSRRLFLWARDVIALWKLHRQDRQRERLAALKRLDRRGFPRGY